MQQCPSTSNAFFTYAVDGAAPPLSTMTGLRVSKKGYQFKMDQGQEEVRVDKG